MKRGAAAAKLNLALVVGPRRDDGMHELVTVYQRIALADLLEVRAAARPEVSGFADDTLVARALAALAESAGVEPRLAARIEKRIPVAAGLGGGSADAAAALRLGNELLAAPLSAERLESIAAGLGADVPFFLRDGPQLGTGDGTDLSPLDLPQDYWVVLVAPDGVAKTSTADVYAEFDARGGEAGFEERRSALLAVLEQIRRPRDLATLPPNDLASSPLGDELRHAGAFRADVTGAGPTVYGLFLHGAAARGAQRHLRRFGRTWMTAPAWYV
jgi:4-diphosphocytidyl-2-C-methyl-D-erythritol kinase